MRYGAIPTSPLEWLALHSGKVPVPILDFMVPLLQTRALMAAVRLGVFEALRAGPRSVAEISRERGLDAETLALVLRVLEASGYVRRLGQTYELTDVSRQSLLEGSRMALVGFARWNYWQWEKVERLDEVLVTGRGLDFHRTMDAPSDWEDYQRAMLEMARAQARVAVPLIQVPKGATRLLDLAGSHGLLGAALCRAHPPLRSTVCELPAAIEIARALAREERIDDVVTHVEADLRTDPLPEGADLALLANILHHFQRETAVVILERAARALRPGGRIAIWDVERRPDGAPSELVGDAMSLWFRITSEARCHAAEDYASFLEAAGFRVLGVKRSWLAPMQVLVHGERT